MLNIIESTQDHHPNFVLFLGAGASVTSGVKTASQMITEWREIYYQMHKEENQSPEDFFKHRHWNGCEEEYSFLFEELFDEPSQRREYIESCINDASPSWGYIYLVNLIRQKVFNTVFTTNFDDLLNEACYTFSSDVRPLVSAHDSSIKSLRITAQRPKIIKLHGDYLFDNIKNTVRELETLEQNMLEKFKQFASEYGFIFIGYSGNDRSIMDTLNLLLKNEENFPHGIYWCIRKGDRINRTLESLSRYPKVRFVEIDGFDEIFAEINEKLALSLQPEMTDPYAALANKLDNLLDKIKLSEDESETNPIIRKHIKHLGNKILTTSIVKEQTGIVEDDGGVKLTIPVPLSLLASINEREGQYDLAKDFAMKSIKKQKSLRNYEELIRILFKSKDNDNINIIHDEIINNDELLATDFDILLNIIVLYISNKSYENAYDLIERAYIVSEKYDIEINYEYFKLNELQIRKHKGEDYTEEEIKILNELCDSEDALTVYGAKILLEDYEEANLILMKQAGRSDISYIRNWPITKLLINNYKDNIFDNK